MEPKRYEKSRTILFKYLQGISFSVLWYGSILLGFYSLYCPVLPLIFINRKLYRKMTECIFAIWESFAVGLMEIFYGVEFRLCGDWIRPFETSILVMNHRNRLDWNFLWGALAHGTLPPAHNCKIVLKAPIKHFPGLGWIMQMTSFLYLKRNWREDQEVISKTVKYFRDIKLTYQILLFPEGTNLCEDTKSKSDAFATKSGLPLYDYVLHPRTTGFAFLASEMIKRNNLDSIYDITVFYPKTLPISEMDMIRGNIPEEVHFLIKRYPIEEIPKIEEGLKEWLLKLWQTKEKTLQEAHERKCFIDTRNKSYPVNASYLALLFWLSLMTGILYLLWNSTLVQIWCFLHSVLFIVISIYTEGIQHFEMLLHEQSLKEKKI